MLECKGDGTCLKQTNTENQYEKHIDIICNYNCEPLKCFNYNICNSVNPK